MLIHVVKPGEYIYMIAKIYRVSPQAIVEANQLDNPNLLVIGQTLVIPTNNFTHIVVRGESLYAIAKYYGIPLQTLIAVNPQITNPSLIYVGQNIIIPQGPQKLGMIYVSGYALPGIDPAVLENVLPYLTFIDIFSYQVNARGGLKTIDDTRIIQAALSAGVAPIMVITNFEDDEGFSSELAHAVLASEEVQNTLITNILSVLKAKNYYGVDVDFEYIYPEDRENFNDFIAKLVDALHPLGYIVSVALAPKERADQAGLLYSAHDYPAIGTVADFITLMTYEWGYRFGPAMAVSPINEVKKVLDYAITAIPSEKILLGMPNYGYDWTLPFVEGVAAKTITNREAENLAAQFGASIIYNEASQAPYFNYYDSAGRQHEVWFDDARSIAARLKLIDTYGLGGVSYWSVNNFYPLNWLVLSSMYDIVKVV